MGIFNVQSYLDIPPKYKYRLIALYLVYTLVLGGIIGTIIDNVTNDSKEFNCNAWTNVYYYNDTSSALNELTFYGKFGTNTTQSYMCTEGATTAQLHYGISPFVTICGTAIFMAYIFYGVLQVGEANALVKVLKAKETGVTELDVLTLKVMALCNTLQVFIVEIGGFMLLTSSVSAVDLLINSSATIFLSEVDDLVAEIVLKNAAMAMDTTFPMEYLGIEFEYVPEEQKKKASAPATSITDATSGSATVSDLHAKNDTEMSAL